MIGNKSNLPAPNLTNPSLTKLNQSYANKIAEGQISVTPNSSKKRLGSAEHYDQVMKSKKIAQAQKEKQELEKRLDYLNKSIQSIKQYNYGSAKPTSTEPNTSKPSPNHQDQKKKKDQVKKKIKEYQQLLRKKKSAEKKRKMQQQQKQLKLKQEQSQAQKIQRKQKIYENMQKIKKRVQDRQQSLKKQQQQYKKITQQKTLFRKIQQDFAQKQSSMLQQRKKKLADIRNLHRPVSFAEIADHEKTFFQVLKQKESMRERQRRINNASQSYRVSYRSPTHMKLAQGQKQIKQDQSRIKASKVKQFSQHVRDNFIPAIDERKRQYIQNLIEEEGERKRKQLQKQEQDKQRVEQIKNKGLRYLQQIKELPKKRNTSHHQSAPKSQRIQYKNYLTHSQNSGTKNWGNILQSNHNKKQKALRLKFQAQKLENSLKLRQQKVRLLKGDTDEIDQEYYEMIKAKLDLLQI